MSETIQRVEHVLEEMRDAMAYPVERFLELRDQLSEEARNNIFLFFVAFWVVMMLIWLGVYCIAQIVNMQCPSCGDLADEACRIRRADSKKDE